MRVLRMEVWSSGKLVEVFEKHVDQITEGDMKRLSSTAMITNILGLDAGAEIKITAKLK